MKETLKFDVFEKHLQGHPTASASGTGARMTFHGHGSQKEDRDTNIRRYVRDLAGRISTILGGERSPLILAGLPHLLSEFTASCDYPGLLNDHVVVDPGHMKIDELHRRSLEKANGYFRKDLEEALERYGAASASGSAITGTVNAVKMSARGRVDTLLVAPDLSAYGRFDPKTGETVLNEERQPGDSDLISLAVEETLLKGVRFSPRRRTGSRKTRHSGDTPLLGRLFFGIVLFRFTPENENGDLGVLDHFVRHRAEDLRYDVIVLAAVYHHQVVITLFALIDYGGANGSRADYPACDALNGYGLLHYLAH